jgi:hypothetical protein
MIKAYFDGSYYGGGNSDDPRCRSVTLSGFAASESVWKKFEIDWGKVLAKYGISSFHMSDAMSLGGKFSRRHGWDEIKRSRLIGELLEVLGKLRFINKFALESNLIASTCTVLMDDYRRAKKENPKLRTPEAICVRFCVNQMPYDIDIVSGGDRPQFVLFFDRNEKFLHTIKRVWDRHKKKPEAGWPKQINLITDGNSMEMRPFQAADMFAWVVNKHNRGESSPYAIATFLVTAHYSFLFDYNKIKEIFPNG